MQDLRARQEPKGPAPRYSNLFLHQQQTVHGNRKALFWCESRHFEATHVIPQLLTSSPQDHMQAEHASGTLDERSTQAERMGAVGGANSAVNNGVNNGVNTPMQGLRKRGCASLNRGIYACKIGSQKKVPRSSTRSSTRASTRASQQAGSEPQGACMAGMRGDAGEVWVNAFVVGTGNKRKVRAAGK